jgi:hypothetical protein
MGPVSTDFRMQNIREYHKQLKRQTACDVQCLDHKLQFLMFQLYVLLDKYLS